MEEKEAEEAMVELEEEEDADLMGVMLVNLEVEQMEAQEETEGVEEEGEMVELEAWEAT